MSLLLFVSLGLASASVVQTSLGSLVGNDLDGVSEFLGIPFAKPPVGELRFKRTIDWKEPYEGNSRQATKFGADCLSHKQQRAEEDCLFLNVWTPSSFVNSNNKSLPVLVFIHGGSFLDGSGAKYNGTVLAANTQSVVVTINYRLGALGWLLINGTGNFGLKDQRSALRWVQREISNFGGDTDDIAVFGESAGAISILLQMVAPFNGLFSRAIVESGNVHANPMEVANNMTANFLRCSPCDGADDVVECLQKQSLFTIDHSEKCGSNEKNPFTDPSYAPVIDGEDIPRDPLEMLKDGDFGLDVDVIIGSNSDEGTLFIYPNYILPMTASKYKQYIKDVINNAKGADPSDSEMSQILSLYPPQGIDNKKQAAALIGDATFTCGSRRFSRLFSSHGGTVYQYHFDQRLQSDKTPSFLGVYHASELPLVFGGNVNGQTPFFTPGELTLSTTMQNMWAHMAKYGKPRDDALWPQYTSTSDPSLVLAVNITTESGRRAKYCDLWESLGF